MSNLHKKTLAQRKANIAPVIFKDIFIKDIKAFKVDKDSKTVSGYLAVFGNEDSDGDVLIKGCFAKSLSERGVGSATHRKIAFCWQHDLKDPIGYFTVLKEDDFGLYFEAVLDLGVKNADRTLIQLQSGTLDQFSIGFQYIWDKCDWDSETSTLIVKEVNLFEGSVVTLGANEMTFFTGMKSSLKEQREKELQDDTEAFIKSLHPKHQYDARLIILKHIQYVRATKDDDTAGEDDSSDDDNISFIDAFCDHMDDGDSLVDDCYDDLDDDDVIGMADDVKSFNDGMRTKMQDKKTSINSKSHPLKNRKPAGRKTKKPLPKPEPDKPAFDINKLTNAL